MAEPTPAPFEGHGSGAEHRTTGNRAWCHECQEWCYPEYPCGSSSCCSEKTTGRPRRWELPPEPGPEVTAVRCDCHAQNWYRDEPQWLSKGYPFRAYRWPGLLANHPRLTDATGEQP